MPYKDKDKERANRLARREKISAQRKARYHANHEKYKAGWQARYKANATKINAKAAETRKTKEGWVRSILARLKARAKKLGLDYNLSASDFTTLPQTCPVLGLPLEFNSGNPNAYSVDRIDNSRGYVSGNICVMSDRANRLKRDASIAELRALGAWANKQTGEN